MRKTAFSRLHPFGLLVFAAAALLPAMTWRPLWAGCAGLLAALLSAFAQGGPKRIRALAPLTLLMGLTALLLTPVFNRTGKTVLFTVLGNPVTLEAAAAGAMFALSIMTVLAVFGIMNSAFGPDEILYIFSGVLPQTALVLTLTARFMPELRRRLDEIRLLRASLGSRSPVSLMRYGMDALGTLMSWSTEDAVVTAQSMRARGYGLARRRSRFRARRFGAGSIALMAVSAALSAAALLAPGPLAAAAWVAVLSLPLLLEGWEALRWRIYVLTA